MLRPRVEIFQRVVRLADFREHLGLLLWRVLFYEFEVAFANRVVGRIGRDAEGRVSVGHRRYLPPKRNSNGLRNSGMDRIASSTSSRSNWCAGFLEV